MWDSTCNGVVAHAQVQARVCNVHIIDMTLPLDSWLQKVHVVQLQKSSVHTK